MTDQTLEPDDDEIPENPDLEGDEEEVEDGEDD